MLAKLWKIMKQASLKWWDDNALRLSASLSYYTLFSLAPLLVVVIAVAGFVWGEEGVQRTVITQIQLMIGEESAMAVNTMLERVRQPMTGALATVLSIIAIIVLSSGVFAELQDALNTIWGIKPVTGGLWRILKDRFFSFIFVIGIGFLLLVSLLLSAAIGVVGRFLTQALPGPEYVLQLISGAVSFALFTIFFAMLFKILPNAHIAWRDVWVGALATAVFFTVGKWAIAVYLGETGLTSAYGAASSLAVILLWVYYSALIFYLGAEFTYVYANQYGSHIEAEGKGTAAGEGNEAIRLPCPLLSLLAFFD